MIKRLVLLLLMPLLIVFALTGCGRAARPAQEEIQTASAQTVEPVTLTMLCNFNDVTAQTFADAVHAKLPHITVEYEPCPIGAIPYADEVGRRVMHDMEADIFMTTDTRLWNSGKLLNLTDEEFVSRYNLSIMKTLSGDGSVYYIPGVGDVQCYIYNAHWLEELNLQVPQTLDELGLVFEAMSKAGKSPFITPYSQMPAQYVKVMIAGYLSTPTGQQWMTDYNQGNTTMAQDEQWNTLWKRVEEMAQQGYLLEEDMLFTETRRMVALQEGGGFMTTFSSTQDSGLSAETKEQFQVLALLGEKPGNQMVYTAPTAYFAVSNRLSSSGNSAKRTAALQVLDYVSTPEGQEVLRGTNPLAISYLQGTTLTIEDRYTNLAEIIKMGAYTQTPMLERGVEKVIGEVFEKLVKGEITAEDAIKACDRQNADYVAEIKSDLPVIGTATELFPWTYMQSRAEELAVINFCMDSMRKEAGTDYAIELGTAFRGEFFKGDLTTADVESVIRQDKKLYTVEVTGQQIWDIIEQGVTQQNSSWFIAASGFCYSYQRAVGDTAGELVEVTLEDAAPLDLQTKYTVAISENQMMDLTDAYTFFGIENKELPFTLREAVINNISEQGKISPVTDGRIQIVTQ